MGNKNIPQDVLFATPSGITSFWVSALGGIHVLGGESSQMLGEKFDGNSYSDTIINSPSIDEKLNLIRKFGVQYVYITVRTPVRSLLWKNEYNVDGLKAFDNAQYFEFIHKKEDSISGVYVVKIKENLSPNYNLPKIDKGVTILGYIISMMTLFAMIGMTIGENVRNNTKKNVKQNSKG